MCCIKNRQEDGTKDGKHYYFLQFNYLRGKFLLRNGQIMLESLSQ